MASGDMVPEHAKQHKLKEKKPQARSLEGESEADGAFTFEAHEAWKDFHNSLRQFYEARELCDITLKVITKEPACHICFHHNHVG